MVTAINPGGLGGKEGKGFTTKGIMEHKVIANLRCVNGDKSLFRRWRQRLITALGKYDHVHEEIAQHVVKEMDFGKDLDKIAEDLRITYGREFVRISGDVWNVLPDKAKNDPCDKIKHFCKGDGVTAYGVLYRWFTDVSGLSLAEQARMLMHPSPLEKEEELAEYLEVWQEKMRRLEAHGGEFKLATLFKINALRMLMTGKAKEYLDL